MAFPSPRGMIPGEIEFLAEMEMVTVVPRQRLEGLELLGGPTEPLLPPRRASLPLWLAILLKRQRRINIVPPFWIHTESLSLILEVETEHEEYRNAFSPSTPLPFESRGSGRRVSTGTGQPRRTLDGQRYYATPPFLPQNTALPSTEESSTNKDIALPYHWIEVGHILLDVASDDLQDPDQIRRLLKDLREVRMAKMRKGVDTLDAAATEGGGIQLTGVGAMEIGEMRGFVAGVIDGLRKMGATKEQTRREQLAEDPNRDYNDTQDDDGMEI